MTLIDLPSEDLFPTGYYLVTLNDLDKDFYAGTAIMWMEKDGNRIKCLGPLNKRASQVFSDYILPHAVEQMLPAKELLKGFKGFKGLRE